MRERLLSGPRNVLRDLVAKRLWPVAILLVVAAVAVPVVIAGGGHSAVPEAPAPAPSAGPAADAAITVSAPAVLGRSRPGPVRDPFFDPPAQKSGDVRSPSTSTSKSTSTSSATPAAASPGGKSATTTPKTRPAESPPRSSGAGAPAPSGGLSVHRARVRWGADDGAAVRGLSRLQPLGGTSNPALLYLGTTDDHTQAVFVLGPGALTDAAKGRCAEQTCRIVSLKAGQSLAVGVVGVDGGPDRRYVLTVDAIAQIAVASESAAREQRARVHPAGRGVLRAIIKDRPTAAAIGQFSYDPSTGAVVRITAPQDPPGTAP